MGKAIQIHEDNLQPFLERVGWFWRVHITSEALAFWLERIGGNRSTLSSVVRLFGKSCAIRYLSTERVRVRQKMLMLSNYRILRLAPIMGVALLAFVLPVWRFYNPPQSPVMAAILSNNVEAVRNYLKSGTGGVLEYRGNAIVSPAIVEAAAKGHAEIILLLLEHGENINMSDNYNETALSAAVSNGNDKIVRLLLEHGASISQEDIDSARAGGHMDIVAILESRSRHSAHR